MAESFAAKNTHRQPRGVRHFILIGLVLLFVIVPISSWLAYLYFDRTPGELLRYTERRISGHPKLEMITFPVMDMLRPLIERTVPVNSLPTMGKGQQVYALSTQQYKADGQPVPMPAHAAKGLTPSLANLATEAEIQSAIARAKPGDVLSLAPGTYRFGGNLRLKNAGSAEKPITLGASEPGNVIFELTAQEGFVVEAPYWIIENLTIRGICKADEDCEHAFHVIGKARGTVIRNNRIEDFNAQIKVNGYQDHWPDDGLIQFNTIRNSRPRNTHHSVTLIDIVGANRWQIVDNLVSNFIKGQGNQISYGMFIKGGASGGRIERNLVICTEKDISRPGSRVGVSFGGGGTDKPLCRDARCITEHSDGIIAHNIVAHCNDFGIYINRSNQSLIAHNTLINTYGIDVRFPASSAETYGNLLDGRIRAREGGIITDQYDQFFRRPDVASQADKFEFGWIKNLGSVPSHPRVKGNDCGRDTTAIEKMRPGALQSSQDQLPNC